MGSSDPEMRMRQLAILRAAYDTCSGLPGDHARGSAARHAKVLLGRILVVLGGMPDDAVGSAIEPGKARRGE